MAPLAEISSFKFLPFEKPRKLTTQDPDLQLLRRQLNLSVNANISGYVFPKGSFLEAVANKLAAQNRTLTSDYEKEYANKLPSSLLAAFAQNIRISYLGKQDEEHKPKVILGGTGWVYINATQPLFFLLAAEALTLPLEYYQEVKQYGKGVVVNTSPNGIVSKRLLSIPKSQEPEQNGMGITRFSYGLLGEKDKLSGEINTVFVFRQ